MNEGALPELPGGWVWTTVGELYDIVGGGTPSTSIAEYWEGDIPWITSADIYNLKDIRPRKYITKKAVENSATNLVPEGSLIVVTRVGLGRIAITNTPLCFSQDSQALIGNNSLLFPDYSLYYLSKAVQIFKYEHRGTTIAGVTKKQLSELAFALPPLPEQRRIVTKIEELFTKLDAGVDALKKTQAQLKRYRQSVLKAACEGKLVPTEAELARAEGRTYEPADVLLARILKERHEKLNKGAKYKEPAAPDTSGLPALPEGWRWATLPQLGDLARGKSKHRPRDDKRLFGGSYPFIQTGDIKNSNGRIKNFSQTYSEFGLAQSRLWPAGTLCITIAANIADSGILTFPSCFPDSVVGFVCEDTNCDVRFIEFFIRTAKKDLEKYAPATAQKNINLETLGNLAVPLPPLAEQRRIVAEVERRLSVADEVAKTVEQSLAQAQRLRQSILKRAFEGKLMPQDPEDEPAGMLLERIKAERARMGEEKRKQKQTKLLVVESSRV